MTIDSRHRVSFSFIGLRSVVAIDSRYRAFAVGAAGAGTVPVDLEPEAVM
jgi:hypothetical protein